MDPGRLPALTQEQCAAPAFAQRCKRLLHRQIECRICVDVCPEDAITLDPGPAVSKSCTRCGLCQTACPTEVFQGEVHSDRQVLGRIGSKLRPQPRATKGQPLYVHCREAEPQHRDSVAVPCLGSVTGNFLLGAVALGASPLTLVRGDCGRCRLRDGEKLFARAVAVYVALGPGIGFDVSALVLEQRQRRDGAVPARRRFFARVAGRGEHRGAHWPAPGTDGPAACLGAAEPGVGPTPGRMMLQTLLRGASGSPTRSLRYDAGLPWARLRIDQHDCSTCDICVNLCPTGAITRSIESDRLSYHFNSALCVNCRLCEECCPQQVISFEPEFDARDLLREEARIITSIRLHACEICGETLAEREGRFCITCQRRGRVENHIAGAVAGIN